MVIAVSEAFKKTFGLVVTFGGIGVIVNVLIVYILVLLRGERRQNQQFIVTRRPPED
jgi:hypothetical protein